MMTIQEWKQRIQILRDLSARAEIFEDRVIQNDAVGISIPLSREELKIVNELCRKESTILEDRCMRWLHNSKDAL